jgi:hypothetical protein
MRRNVSQPVDAGGFHGGLGVQALGDGARDEGLTLFGQPVQKRALLLSQRIDPRRLLIQKPRNPPLEFERRKGDKGVLQRVLPKPVTRHSIRAQLELIVQRFRAAEP